MLILIELGSIPQLVLCFINVELQNNYFTIVTDKFCLSKLDRIFFSLLD